MKVLLIFVIAIPRIRFFHTVTTNVIFGKFSTFSTFSKFSKMAPNTCLMMERIQCQSFINDDLLEHEKSWATNTAFAIYAKIFKSIFLHSIVINIVRCYCFQYCGSPSLLCHFLTIYYLYFVLTLSEIPC